jgi:hypothetical protein
MNGKSIYPAVHELTALYFEEHKAAPQGLRPEVCG